MDLTELDEELHKLDKSDEASPRLNKRLRGYEGFEGWNKDQRELVGKVQAKLCEYCKAVAA